MAISSHVMILLDSLFCNDDMIAENTFLFQMDQEITRKRLREQMKELQNQYTALEKVCTRKHRDVCYFLFFVAIKATGARPRGRESCSGRSRNSFNDANAGAFTTCKPSPGVDEKS